MRYFKFILFSPFKQILLGNCIGARMGKLQTKLGMAIILSKFSFEFVDQIWQKREVTFDPRLIVIAPRENVMIKIRKRK